MKMFAKSKISQSMIDAVNSVLEKVDEVEATIISEKYNAKKRTTDGLDGPNKKLTPDHKKENAWTSTKGELKAEGTLQDIGEVLDTSKSIQSYLKKSAAKRASLVKGDSITNPEHSEIRRKLEKSNKGFDKAIEKQYKKQYEELSFSKKMLESMKPQSTPDFDDIDEGMTPSQTKKREEIVLAMKDKEQQFKAKYGKNWQNVMYATATKMAMKEEVELGESHDDEKEDKTLIKKLVKKKCLSSEGKQPLEDNVPFIANEVADSVSRIKKVAREHVKRIKGN